MKIMKKTWLVGALATASVFCCSLGAVNAFAQDATLSGVNFEEEYAKGTMLTIPEGKLTVNGSEMTAQAEVVFPDGGRYALSTINLSQVGIYKVNYSCRVGGKKYTETVDFSVYNSLYQVNNSILAKAEYDSEYEVYEEFDGSTSKLNGIFVDLPSGAEFQFNEIIDLSKMNKLDSIVDFIVLPTEQGKHDAETLYFQLTDIYNPDNYVRVSYQKRSANTLYGLQSAYVKAGAAFQPFVGYEAGLDKIHTNTIYGCPTEMSFCGVPKITTSEDPTPAALKKDAFATLSMDYANKQVYTTAFGKQPSMVVDLDSARYFTDKWDGFTTGEVYLTVYAGNYVGANSVKLFISSVSNFKGDDMSNNKLIDRVKPRLTVDYSGVDAGNLPNAIVGCTYPVFNATALDSVDGEVEVKTSVYYNYQSTNRSLCNIIDGRVRVARSGIYTVIYEATDGSGNTARQVYTFTAKASTQSLTAEIVAGAATTTSVGSKVVLPNVNVSNYVQSYQTEVEVTYGGEKIAVENNSFVPNKVGAYKVNYTVEDFVGQKKTTSYTLTVQNTNTGAPVFYEEPIFPKYLISGKTYEIPALTAYDYSSDVNGKEITPKKYLTDKNGRVEVTNSFTPVVSKSGNTVLVEYVAKNAQNKQTTVSKTIPCYIVTKDGGTGLDMTKYFVKKGSVDVKASSSSTVFTTSENKAGFTFLNALLADQLSIYMNVVSGSKFEKLNVYLTDYANENVQVKVSFIKTGSTAAVSINDSSDRFELDSSFGNEKLMPVTFNAFVNTITTENNDSLILPVTKTLAGENFNGFPSGKAYLSVEFEGVTGSSSIKVTRISAQGIGSSEKDSGKPNIGVLGVYPVQYELNSVVTLFDAIAMDVLDPNVTFTMSVRDADNKYLKDVNTGVELKNVPVKAYTIKMDKYGAYKVTYTATDTSEKKSTEPITLTVFDDVNPVITLEDEMPTSMKKNKSITIPKATATDNLDGKLKVYVYVEDPTGMVSMMVGSVSENYTFKPTSSGLYVIKYLATDKAGNVSIVNCEIWVS